MERPSRVGMAHRNWLTIFGGRCLPSACALVAVCALVLTQGCGGAAYEYDSVVTGTVTIDGELAKAGTVTFHPVKNGRAAIGRIYPDGSYSLRTGQGDLAKGDGGTVASGEYVVTVSITGPAEAGAVVSEGGPPKPGPSLIAKRYAQKDTTDLRFSVKPCKQVIVIDLKAAEQEAPADEASKAAAPAGKNGGNSTEQVTPPGETKAGLKKESKTETPPRPPAAPAAGNSTARPDK